MRTILILCLFSIASCATNQPLTLFYSDLKFNLPSNPVAMSLSGGDEDILIIKYSNKLGKEYLAFTKETALEIGKCSYKQFFALAVSDKKAEDCGKGVISNFRSVFFSGEDLGTGARYLFKMKNGKTFIFLISDEYAIIKIESDFMDKEALNRIF